MLTYLLFSKCLEKFVFVYCIGFHWFGNHQKSCVPLKRKMRNTIFNNDKQHFTVRFLNLRFLKFNCNLMWLSISAQLGFYLTLAEVLSELFWSKFVLFPRRRCTRRFTLSSYSPEPLGKFQPHLGQSILLLKGIQSCSNVGPRPFQRGDNKEKAKKIDVI